MKGCRRITSPTAFCFVPITAIVFELNTMVRVTIRYRRRRNGECAVPKLRSFAAGDILVILMTATVAVFASCIQAHAYVDPSVMTYTIQAVAGVAVALSAVIGVALRRSRKLFMRVFHIDENAGKQVEPDVHAVDMHDALAFEEYSSAEASARETKSNLSASSKVKSLAWPQRLLRAFLACFFLITTLFIVAPIEIVNGGAASLSFNAGDIAWLVIAAGVIASGVLALAMSAIKGKAFDVVVCLIVAFGFCCYIQALLLNFSLPDADGTALVLADYTKITLISTIVWILIIVVFLVFNSKIKRVWRILSMAVCIFFILIQFIGVASLFVSTSDEVRPVVTKEGLFDIGSDGNVVVFVLDTFDTKEMNHLLEDDPSIADEFTGFTYFPDSVGSIIPTSFAIPFLLSGNTPQETDTFASYVESLYTTSTFLPEIKERGYDIGIYSDSIEGGVVGDHGIEGIELVYEQASNLESGGVKIDPLRALLTLDKVALYRDMPWIAKPPFWFTTDDLNKDVISDEAGDSMPYKIDDVAYNDELMSRGLALKKGEKAFRFIHLLGSHYPYTMDEHARRAEGETTLDQQSLGSLLIVENYMDELKRLGVYDKTTIIVTADHGEWYLTDKPIERTSTPIMLVKPAQTAQEASEPMKVSYAPTGHLDYPATVIDAVGGDASRYGPTVFEADDADRPRYFWWPTSDGKDLIDLIEYKVRGNALDFDNWELTGTAIVARDD